LAQESDKDMTLVFVHALADDLNLTMEK